MNNQKELILLQDLGYLKPTEKSTYKKRYGIYKCSCGNEFKTMTESVRVGKTVSCGCYNKQKSTIHGLRHHRIYKIWDGIKQRCFNKNNCNYFKYGEVGITICNEWREDFLNFYNWSLQNGYKDNLSIDRINNDGNYEPNNCRWTTRETQQRNQRKIRSNNTSGYRGVYWNKVVKGWVARITVSNKMIHIGTFNNAIDGAKAYDSYIIEHKLEHTRNLN